MRKRYYGSITWYYRFPRGKKESVDIVVPTSNRMEDEGMARHYIRKKHDLKRLPKGTRVWPMTDGE